MGAPASAPSFWKKALLGSKPYEEVVCTATEGCEAGTTLTYSPPGYSATIAPARAVRFAMYVAEPGSSGAFETSWLYGYPGGKRGQPAIVGPGAVAPSAEPVSAPPASGVPTTDPPPSSAAPSLGEPSSAAAPPSSRAAPSRAAAS